MTRTDVLLTDKGLELTDEGKVRMEKLRSDYGKRKIRGTINWALPESKNQRGYFEGGVCTLFAYFQDWSDHTNYKHVLECRKIIKDEALGVTVEITGVGTRKVSDSSKGKENISKCIDWALDYFTDQGEFNDFVLNTQNYKDWVLAMQFDENIPDNYIDYCKSIGKLK